MKKKIRNETVLIVSCIVYSPLGVQVGNGYTIIRQSGMALPQFWKLDGTEMPSGFYDIRHTDEMDRLGIANWTVQ